MHFSLRNGFAVVCCLLAHMNPPASYGAPEEKTKTKIEEMREEIARQNSRIEQLEQAIAQQARLLNQLQLQLQGAGRSGTASQPTAAAGTSAAIIEPAGPKEETEIAPAVATRKEEKPRRILGGVQLSGDLRFRFDLQARSSNASAPALQNLRGRYRIRVNADRDLDSRFRFHLQLSTGALNNYLTNDQDFGAIGAKHSFAIAEGYIDFHPNENFSIRGGRMEEVFADNMRLQWDDDIRFNGFQEIATIHLRSTTLKALEFRAGQYILSNPNIVVLSPSSPFVSAGSVPGQKVRDSNLFHQGITLKGDLGTKWNQRLTADVQLYRNPNQIQLASLASGFPVLISNTLGIALSGPPSAGLGNATTTPGGAIYSAPSFSVGRVAYRTETKSLLLGDHSVPFYFDLQLSRNFGTSRWRDAMIASVNFGSVTRARDVRLLYQFAVKDPNSLISQFTDDDLGTGSGVNITVHAIRFDLGLTRFLQWQNLFFIQMQRRQSIPSQQLFVPLPAGANPTFRFLGQLLFTF